MTSYRGLHRFLVEPDSFGRFLVGTVHWYAVDLLEMLVVMRVVWCVQGMLVRRPLMTMDAWLAMVTLRRCIVVCMRDGCCVTAQHSKSIRLWMLHLQPPLLELSLLVNAQLEKLT